MARRMLLALCALCAAAAAFYLRTLQHAAAFDAEGLPVSGAPETLWLWGLFAGAALLVFLLALPEKRKGCPLVQRLQASPLGAVFSFAGLALLAACGGWRVYLALPARELPELALGALTALSAAALLPTVLASLGRESRAAAPLSLLPMCAAAAELIVVYRADAIDPLLIVYDADILALAAAALTAVLLCSLAYRAACVRRFLLSAALTVVFCGAALADGHGLPASLGYVGCALTAFGLLVSLLQNLNRTAVKPRRYELVETEPFSARPLPRVDAAAPENAAPSPVGEPAPCASSPEKAAAGKPAAAPPAPAASGGDGFDLGRVDELMQTLEEEARQRGEQQP